MLMLLRASLTAALVTFSAFSAFAADKPYHRDDLAEASIRFEGETKTSAGGVSKSQATLRREADTALSRNDQRAALAALGQIASVAPNDAGNWLKLARTILQGRSSDTERQALLERASSAAYLAYERTTNRNEEADALVILGRTLSERTLWRPALDALRLSLDLREAADVRAQYVKMRDDYGFRLLDGREHAARLLPVLRDAARQAGGLRAVRERGGCRQAGALGRR
jgi:hypothetical protein